MDGNDIRLFAFMYKRSGVWRWAEVTPGGDVHYGVNDNTAICTSCHSQPGNRDLVRSFEYH